MATKKEETVSLEEAAKAFIALHDSGNYNGRRYDRAIGFLRDAVNPPAGGPIEPDEKHPPLDEEQEQAVEERLWEGARVHDLVHPGGRLQRAKESVDEILKKAEEGTLANDGARQMAREAREAAKEAARVSREDVQKIEVVPTGRKPVDPKDLEHPADEQSEKAESKSKSSESKTESKSETK